MGDKRVTPADVRVEIVLRDVEDLLRVKLGNDLIVESFETRSLLASGNNYGSTMLRVDVIVRYGGRESETQKLYLVAKMVPPMEFQKKLFNSPLTFPKEIYMFEKILPTYKDLERECGVPEVEVFDLLPKFFGSRLSLEKSHDKFDDDAVILMENLKIRNYACVDKKIGCDLEHAKFAVKALARFHAIGFAAKLKKPEIFEEFKKYAKTVSFVEKFFTQSNSFILKSLKKTPALIPHMPRIEKLLFRSESDFCKLNTVVEPWGTINHVDFWLNNIMFLDDEGGSPIDVKFVDFQEYAYLTPTRDLVYFIFTSCEKEVRSSHVEELCDLYYHELLSRLRRMKCDVISFSKDSFNERLTVAANLEYFRCMLVSKLLTVDDKTNEAKKTAGIFETEPSDECVRRMAEITWKFIEKNWI